MATSVAIDNPPKLWYNIYIMNSKEFSLKIESIVKEKHTTYMEAVILYCEQNEIDVGSVSSLISKNLKGKNKNGSSRFAYVKDT